MSNFEFISHDAFPEDEYIKEMVYLCFEGKYRVLYVRKPNKNGGLFWVEASAGATRNGQKEHFPAFLQDSNFLQKDILDYLNKRKWEGRAAYAPSASLNFSGASLPPANYSEILANEDAIQF